MVEHLAPRTSHLAPHSVHSDPWRCMSKERKQERPNITSLHLGKWSHFSAVSKYSIRNRKQAHRRLNNTNCTRETENALIAYLNEGRHLKLWQVWKQVERWRDWNNFVETIIKVFTLLKWSAYSCWIVARWRWHGLSHQQHNNLLLRYYYLPSYLKTSIKTSAIDR